MLKLVVNDQVLINDKVTVGTFLIRLKMLERLDIKIPIEVLKIKKNQLGRITEITLNQDL